MPFFGRNIKTHSALILGDSIAKSYTPLVKKICREYRITHRPAKSADMLLSVLDQLLPQKQWSVVHFNTGLHDIKRGKLPLSFDFDLYGDKLAQSCKMIEQSGARAIFATTTYVPEGADRRKRGDEEKLNEAAIRSLNGTSINDLFSASKTLAPQLPNNVHFTQTGYWVLASLVASAIERRQIYGP